MKKNTKRKKTKKRGLNLKYIIIFLLIVIFSLAAFITGVLVTQKNYQKEIKKTQNALEILQAKIKKLEREKPQITVPSEILDLKKAQKNAEKKPVTPPPPIRPTPVKNNIQKPKLVIIIDDVSFKGQVRRIKQIPFKITPSFFPPTNRHPNTPAYAKSFSHYMIHLPMQAIHFNKPEPKTINVNDSYETILNRIIEVKKDFPKAKFINNHTGSTFTADTDAMNKFFKALKHENMGFVDSKTTPYSKAEQVNKIYKIPLYARNIFLDNEENSEYIKKQLKKAVKLAKKYGYAIAIGHPHKITLNTLKNSKQILKNVDVVYIDELKNKDGK